MSFPAGRSRRQSSSTSLRMGNSSSPAPALEAERCAQENQGAAARLWNKCPNRGYATWSRHDILSKIRSQQIEIDGVDRTIVVKISPAPELANPSEIGGQDVEVDRVDGVIEIRIARQRISDEQRSAVVDIA